MITSVPAASGVHENAPVTVLIVPLLKSVAAPSWFRRFPSVTLVTVASELSKMRSNWAQTIGVEEDIDCKRPIRDYLG